MKAWILFKEEKFGMCQKLLKEKKNYGDVFVKIYGQMPDRLWFGIMDRLKIGILNSLTVS